MESRHMKAVQALLQHPLLDVNRTDMWGQTPFSHAVEKRYLEAVKLLVSFSKIDVDLKDNGGQTPLPYVAGKNG